MRIGVDGSAFIYPLTGIGTYVFQLLNAWARQSPDDEFIVYLPTDPLFRLDHPNVVYRKPCCIGWGYRLNGLRMTYWYHFWLPVMMRRDRLDCFWEGHGMAPLLTFVPLLLSVHDFVYLRTPETMQRSDRLNRIVRQPLSIRRAHRVVCVSQATADEMRMLYGRPADAVIRPSADPIFAPQPEDAVAAVRVRYALPERYHLVVGTLEPRKNLLLFITCYLEVYARRHEPIPLAVVGADGWSDGALAEKIREGERLGLIKKLGYVEKAALPALYSGARAFFMPSLYEGFGIPLLEARKCGTPVVCSDIAAHRESAGKEALYHTPDRAGITAVLERVAQDAWQGTSDYAASADWSVQSGAAAMAAMMRER